MSGFIVSMTAVAIIFLIFLSCFENVYRKKMFSPNERIQARCIKFREAKRKLKSTI